MKKPEKSPVWYFLVCYTVLLILFFCVEYFGKESFDKNDRKDVWLNILGPSFLGSLYVAFGFYLFANESLDDIPKAFRIIIYVVIIFSLIFTCCYLPKVY